MKHRLLPVLALALASLPLAASAPAPRPAPAFSLPGRQGTVCLDSLRGRVVYVDFWASWCEPCRRSFPWLRSMHARYGAQGLTIVAIDLDKNLDSADAFLAEFPAPFTLAFDPAGRTAEAYRVAAMPSSFLIDRAGNIVHTQTGFDPRKADAAEALIREACAP